MRLIKGNIERIAVDEVKISKLKADGFKELNVSAKAAPEPPAEQPKNLEEMTIPELKALAKEKGIDGANSLNKEDLLSALKEVE